MLVQTSKAIETLVFDFKAFRICFLVSKARVFNMLPFEVRPDSSSLGRRYCSISFNAELSTAPKERLRSMTNCQQSIMESELSESLLCFFRLSFHRLKGCKLLIRINAIKLTYSVNRVFEQSLLNRWPSLLCATRLKIGTMSAHSIVNMLDQPHGLPIWWITIRWSPKKWCFARNSRVATRVVRKSWTYATLFRVILHFRSLGASNSISTVS
jgi:hypothetical protein